MSEILGPPAYFDREFQVEAVKILPGPVLRRAAQGAITTVLGSCVSTCLWDPLERIGGMNHFMLPGDDRPAPGRPGPRRRASASTRWKC